VGAIIQAAKKAGLTHLYAEVAISLAKNQGGDGLAPGFYGAGTLDRLLPAAHAAGIKVIGTIAVALDHVAADARLSAEVAQYRTPRGDRVDGIASDIETNAEEQEVYEYGQLMRAILGSDVLMVANVLHPASSPYYPYEAIAASWNVVSPMDYWHSKPGSYTPAETTAFVSTSLTMLRAAVGPKMPIEELGQMYDIYKDGNGEDGTGGMNSPTATEVATDLRVARQLGCIGVTYFQWQDATQAEWQVLVSTTW
jgi:hypothetical protein